jgi:hypothetical protein
MWIKENRRRYDRSGLRYETDLTDDEWAEIAPLIRPAKPCGNKRSINLREVVSGLMYILDTACQWRAIPKDLAARSTVYDYFERWSSGGNVGAHPSSALRQMSKAGLTAGQSHGGDHRRPERQKRGKGWFPHRPARG